MQTQKLFYEDPHLREFSAQVLSCRKIKDGFAVVLSATAFYPEGGGQPWDLGTLNGVPVTAVREVEGEILHFCERELAPGTAVTGKIDWQRRFDFMQQHSAEHIISGILYKKYGCHNVGFHMGAEVVTFDFDCIIPAADLPEIERLANEAVYQNIPLSCYIPDEQTLKTIPYRTKRELPYPVRLVEIPGYDTCACCGIHVKQTGEIGMIKLLSVVKFHQGVRMEMVCGERARQLLGEIFHQNKLVSQTFSAKLLETGAVAMQKNEALSAEKSRAGMLEKQLCDAIAKAYAGQDTVCYFAQGLSSAGVRELAEKLHAGCSGTVGVFAGSDKAGYQMCLAGEQAQVSELGKALCQALNGRGGGKGGFFQGSIRGSRREIERIFCK